MFSKKHYLALMMAILGIASHAQAATYNVYGTINLDPNASVIDNAIGQTISDTLVGQYAAFSYTVNTNAPDINPDTNVLELENAVTSTANIAGINFIPSNNACLNLAIDCRAVSELNIGGSTYDRQIISGQLLAANAFSPINRLSSFISTGGFNLFTTPQIVDPFSGTIGAGFAIYYFNNNQVNRIGFVLSNITATPVPEPEPKTSLMFGAALLLGIIRMQQRKNPEYKKI